VNPFVYGTVVRGGNFFDRQAESSYIIQTLKGGNNIVLYAPRRFGKTSLIFKIIEEMEKENFICVYFDFMPVYSEESFIRLYTKTISKKQSNINNFAQTITSLVKNIRPTVTFNENGEQEFSVDFVSSVINETTISDLLDITETLGNKKQRVMVFFDEFQEVERLKKVNFENLLRSKIQQQRKTNYLFLGSKTHILEEMFNNKKRAFYNSAAQMMLNSLPREDTIAYLKKNFAAQKISIDNDTALYLINTAGNIPHYIQLLASEVWQYTVNSKTKVTNEIIDICIQKVLAFNSDYYLELFDRQSQSRKQLLNAIVESGKNIFSSAYISAYRLGGPGTVQRASKHLLNDGVIEKINDEYFFADPFFAMFIKNMNNGTMPVPDWY